MFVGIGILLAENQRMKLSGSAAQLSDGPPCHTHARTEE
jgi:hypothetical protein